MLLVRWSTVRRHAADNGRRVASPVKRLLGESTSLTHHRCTRLCLSFT